MFLDLNSACVCVCVCARACVRACCRRHYTQRLCKKCIQLKSFEAVNQHKETSEGLTISRAKIISIWNKKLNSFQFRFYSFLPYYYYYYYYYYFAVVELYFFKSTWCSCWEK